MTVLGAGMVGSAVAVDLARTGFDVTAVDARPEALARVTARAAVNAVQADCASPEAIGRVVAGADLVVGALSSSMASSGCTVKRSVVMYCDTLW